jgi:hypothetical protein
MWGIRDCEGIGFQFNPLAVAQEGRITVSAVKAGKRYRIGALRIISGPPAPQKPPTQAALLLFLGPGLLPALALEHTNGAPALGIEHGPT